jgi:ribonuclease VapC
MTGDIVIDTSALCAILLAEPEAEAMMRILAASSLRWLSAFSHLETSVIIAARKGQTGLLDFDALLQRLRIEVIPFTADQAQLARDAYLRFGRGHHPAGLNLGDCCSYALSRYSGYPLLFKGQDFSRTDVRAPHAE